MKELINRISVFLKRFFSKKLNVIISAVVVVLLVLLILFLIFGRTVKNKFALNEIYDVYPEEVRALYTNLVGTTCTGDLHFNIDVDGGEKKVTELDKSDLLEYVFGYLDKNNLLTTNMDTKLVNDIQKKLFAENVKLTDDVENFKYGEYVYNVKNGKVVGNKDKCESDIKYVSHLYGYFWDKNVLSIDINVAYLKDGKLYNFDNKELGEYDGNAANLATLTEETSYYRVNYVKDGNDYKFLGMEWKHRS